METKHYIGTTVTITIDRPLGSKHPKWGFEYPINYGYVPPSPSSRTSTSATPTRRSRCRTGGRCG